MVERVSPSCTVIGTVSQASLVASTGNGVLVGGGGIVGVGYGILSTCPSLIGHVEERLFAMMILWTEMLLRLYAIREQVSPGPTV